MTNPLAEHYALCNTGDPAEKYANLGDFPHMLDIELTSACNFKCLMCPTGNKSLTRKPVRMSDTTYSRILAQAKDHGTVLRMIGWGEPLMHPRVCDYVAAASAQGLATHINTNASYLDPRRKPPAARYPGRILAARLIAAGLTSLKFSFQGVDRQSYAEMRNIDFFDHLIETIEMVSAVRAERDKPWLAVSTTITDETEEQINRFRERVNPLVDEVSVGNTIFDYFDTSAVRLKAPDRARLSKLKALESVEKRHPDPCPEVFDKLSIHADGSVVVCCNDFNGTQTLGNVNQTPLIELWHHPKIEAYRKRLSMRDYDAPLCESCFDYMGCTSKAKEAA